MSIGRILYNYTAQESDELSVEVDDVIELISLNEDGWWLAKHGMVIGLIPGNYVVLEQQSTKHEGIQFD